jgi:hypothetical protein
MFVLKAWVFRERVCDLADIELGWRSAGARLVLGWRSAGARLELISRRPALHLGSTSAVLNYKLPLSALKLLIQQIQPHVRVERGSGMCVARGLYELWGRSPYTRMFVARTSH